jgi:hypothetical protein
VPITCLNKQFYRRDECSADCPVLRSGGTFSRVRIEHPEDLPAPDERTIDVALLDMNHGWPNLGHDSLVHAVQDAACDLVPLLEPLGMRIRLCSFDVRRSRMIPEAPGGRFALYLGTGGPGDIDPYRNNGIFEGSQGLVEDPSWETPLFGLFDQILDHQGAAMLAVCHTFGVLCRWSQVAAPVLRSAAKGGKSAGILENYLTKEAIRHPWFERFSAELPDGHRLRVVDHRLYDLVPEHALPANVIAIAHETLGIGGPPGEAVTMIEWARDREGVMPRFFGVNSHPEIVDRTRQMMILRQKLDRGEVTQAWYDDRYRVLTETYPDDAKDQRLHLTSDYTLLGPIRFYIQRQLRLRAEALGLPLALHESDSMLLGSAPAVPAGVVGAQA